ncbi:MAG: YfhO family protein [Prevotella sp.]|nr:YfhO family protein [Prevotella sp.]
MQTTVNQTSWWQRMTAQIRRKPWAQTVLALAAIALAGLVVILPLLINGHVNGIDSEYHFSVIRALHQMWQDGTFGSKIFSYSGADFGYGTGLFYPLLPAKICVILMNLLHLNVIGALGIEFFSLFGLSGVVVFFFARRVFGHRGWALVSALCYMFFPYFLTNLYIRFAFSEIFIMLAMPLLFWGLYELVERQNWRAFLPLFIGGYALALHAHVAVTVYITIFVAIYLLCHVKPLFRTKLWIPLVVAGGVVLLLAASFLLPMLLNMGLTRQSEMAGNGLDFWKGTTNMLSYELAPTCFLVLVVFIPFAVLFCRRKEKPRTEYLIFGFTSMVLLLLTPIFPWPLLSFTPFTMLQFPSRLNMILGLPLTLMVPAFLQQINTTKVKTIFATLVGLVLVTALCVAPQLHTWQHLNQTSISFASHLSAEHGNGYNKNGDYFPKGMTREYMYTRGNVLIKNIDTDLEVSELAHYQQLHQIKCCLAACDQDTLITLHLPFDQCAGVTATQYWNTWGREVVPLTLSSDDAGDLVISSPQAAECMLIIDYSAGGALDAYLQAHPFEFVVRAGEATVTNFVKTTTTHYTADVTVTQAAVIELPTFYYRGYEVTFTNAAGEVTRLTPMQGEHGMVEVSVAESGTLTVRFVGNYITVGWAITGIGVIIFVGIGVFCGVKRAKKVALSH